MHKLGTPKVLWMANEQTDGRNDGRTKMDVVDPLLDLRFTKATSKYRPLALPSKHINEGQHHPLAKRHLKGVSLVGRWWPATVCWLGPRYVSLDVNMRFLRIRNTYFINLICWSRYLYQRVRTSWIEPSKDRSGRFRN